MRALGLLLPLTVGLISACSSDDKTVDTAPYPREKLLDPKACSECHYDHYSQWAGSMHAYASIDPVFRAMNARGQKETNGALGDFCIKCHAPLAVSEGGLKDFNAIDQVPQELQGVTCYFCHNVTSITDTHNNPLVLANDQTMRGSTKNPIKFKGHNAEYSPIFDDNVLDAQFQSSNLCGSCHDIVVPSHFSGAAQDVPIEQTFSEWKGSVFADASDPKGVVLNCTSSGGCHMSRPNRGQPLPIANPPDSPVVMPSRVATHLHDFPAIDTALVDGFPEIDTTNQRSAILPNPVPSQQEAIASLLNTEFRVQICAAVQGSTTNTVTVQIENLSAGHNFPSGASQDRRLWAEVHAFKGDQETFASGVVPDGVAATTVPGTFLMYDETLKLDGTTPAHMFWDVATVKSHTIPVSTAAAPNGNIAFSPIYPGSGKPPIVMPERVTVTLWLEAIGLDVIDDLIASGDLDASFRSKIARTQIQLAGETPDPLPDGRPVSYEWTPQKALAVVPHITEESRLCTQNTVPRFSTGNTPPPI